MATSTIDANPGDNSILEDDNDPDLSLETSDDPVRFRENTINLIINERSKIF